MTTAHYSLHTRAVMLSTRTANSYLQAQVRSKLRKRMCDHTHLSEGGRGVRGVAKRVPHDPVTSLPDQVRLAKIIPTIDGQNEGAH